MMQRTCRRENWMYCLSDFADWTAPEIQEQAVLVLAFLLRKRSCRHIREKSQQKTKMEMD